MLRFLTVFAIVAGLGLSLPATVAHSAPATKKAVKKSSQKEADQAVYEDKEEPDTTGHARSLYNCELGNKVTVYQNEKDDKSIALHWRNRLHRLVRVDTSTGAQRFENEKNGLVWIGIPTKAILLDSKRGRQLANECKPDPNASPVKARPMTQLRLPDDKG